MSYEESTTNFSIKELNEINSIEKCFCKHDVKDMFKTIEVFAGCITVTLPFQDYVIIL